MSKYVCTICGYEYDEATNPPFDTLPDDWKCPLCGAPKSAFIKQEEKTEQTIKPQETIKSKKNADVLRQLDNRELAAICSNLAKGCEKQYKMRESELFRKISNYYSERMENESEYTLDKLKKNLDNELKENYVTAHQTADLQKDRGAKRALVWSEKVTKILLSIIERYEKEGDTLLNNSKIWVCDICGFTYIGNTPPAVCPVCKVPGFKILEVM